MSPSATSAGILFAVIFVLAACMPGDDFEGRSETYIRSNIASLSPRTAPAGSTFTVRDIEWIDEDTARVTYGAGTVELTGEIDLRDEDDEIVVSTFRIVTNPDNDDEESSSSDSESSSSSSMTSSASSPSSSSSSTTSSPSSSSSSTTSSSSSMTSSSSAMSSSSY